MNDEGFDHSLLGKFRDRLIRASKERVSFEKLVEEQVLQPDEVQITDATQLVADIAIPNTLGVLWKANRSLLVSLRARDHQVPGIDMEDYRAEARYERLSDTERRGIEPKITELVRWHGMRRARYRGLAKVNLQCLFTALVVNIKRWFNLIRARAPTLSPA